MKRSAELLLLGICLLTAAVPSLAKKKAAKPIIEIFEATLAGHGVVRFEVEEFSTDQDLQELSQSYAKGGKDALENCLNRNEKGRYRYELFQISLQNIRQVYPIRLIKSASQGGVRTLYIIADAADWAYEGAPARTEQIGHHGYPFTVIQLRIEQNGKGVGEQIPFAAIVFNRQGVMDVNPMPMQLDSGNNIVHFANVHTVTR
jgi:hypothetical protein